MSLRKGESDGIIRCLLILGHFMNIVSFLTNTNCSSIGLSLKNDVHEVLSSNGLNSIVVLHSNNLLVF